jgi:hypothetical protein
MADESNELKIAILEQRVNNFYGLISKIDSAIDKLSEVNTNIIKMLAVHDEKIAQNERTESLLTRLNNDLKTELNLTTKDLEKKIDAIVVDVEELNKYKWMSIAFGVIAAIVVGGMFQLASSWDVKINQPLSLPSRTP